MDGFMEIVAAIDSFKGSMTSVQAGKAAAKGIHKVDPEAKVHVRPLADGGEGTVEALVSGMNGTIRKVSVTGPIGKTVVCEYGVIENTGGKTEEKTAVIEIAKAAGLTLLSEEERNPLYTTTYGVGEVIKDAVRNGCRKFIVGIGGSATNDGGAGKIFMNIAKRCPTHAHSGRHVAQPAFHKHNIRRINSDIRSCSDGDSDIRPRKSRRIINPVPNHRHFSFFF